MATQQVAPVTCPQCNTQFSTPVETIINGQDPALKGAFLQGAINVAQCPQCGLVSPLGVPVLYYDLEKEFALVLVPNSIEMSQTEQQKIIGDLTNKVTNSLPQEERKFYLFDPQQFLTMESMAKAILKADGFTEEMLEAQAANAQLIDEFLTAKDEASLKKLVKEHDAELDRDFFEVLTASIQSAQMEGNQAGVQTLFALRELLAQFSSQGKEIIKEIDREMKEVFLKTQNELVDRLLEAKDDKEFEQLVVTGFQLLDYGFFEKLTARIDAATKANDTELVQALTDVRAKILAIKTEYENASKAAMEQGVELLREILQSDNPDKAIDKNLDKFDEAFFAVLSANVQQAQQENQEQAVQTLQMIGNIVMGKLQQQAQAKAQVNPTAAPTSPQIHLP